MKKFLGALGVLSVLVASAVASAGQKWDDPVYINPDWRMAYGSLGSARNSSDYNQYIQIINEGGDSGSSGVWFMAQDADGNFAYCYTDASAIVNVANGADSDSFVRVSWDESNRCTYMEVRTASPTAPKNP